MVYEDIRGSYLLFYDKEISAAEERRTRQNDRTIGDGDAEEQDSCDEESETEENVVE